MPTKLNKILPIIFIGNHAYITAATAIRRHSCKALTLKVHWLDKEPFAKANH